MLGFPQGRAAHLAARRSTPLDSSPDRLAGKISSRAGEAC